MLDSDADHIDAPRTAMDAAREAMQAREERTYTQEEVQQLQAEAVERDRRSRQKQFWENVFMWVVMLAFSSAVYLFFQGVDWVWRQLPWKWAK